MMLQAPTCIGKNSLIIQTEHVLHVNGGRRKKNAMKSPSKCHIGTEVRQRVKYERNEAAKVQRGKERVMMNHTLCPGGNPRIPQTQAQTLGDQPPQRAQHGTAATCQCVTR